MKDLDELDKILNHTVYKHGSGPNGSAGEWEYWENGKPITLKQVLNQYVSKEREQAKLDALTQLKHAYIKLTLRIPAKERIMVVPFIENEIKATLTAAQEGKDG